MAVIYKLEIFGKDIDRIYAQLDDECDAEMVLESLINEMVVVSNAEQLGIEINDKEVDSLINEYKTSLPDIYQKGISIYGKKDFYEGIELQLIYDKLYAMIVEKELSCREEKWKNEFYNSVKEEADFPSGLSQEEFFEEYYIEFEDYIFDAWIQEKRKNAEVRIYKSMEDVK